MTPSEQRLPDPGKELFRCRPRPLLKFFVTRYQGALPPAPWLRFLIPSLAASTETLIVAGLPMVLLAFVFQFVLGLKPPDEPSWMRGLYFGTLAISCPFAVWWFWLSPRADKLVVYETEIRWRISLVCWEWFRSRGSILTSELECFSFRSDCFDAKPPDYGKTTAEKLTRILLELNMSRHDIRFHLRNGKDKTIERFFARFEPADLQRFLTHLATFAERHQIVVASARAETESVA